MSKLFLLILLFSSLSSNAKSIYDTYQTGNETFDRVMNGARFTSSNPERMKKNIQELELEIKQSSNYPALGTAYYFLGYHNYELGSFQDAQTALLKGKALRPSLSTTTPMDSYLEDIEKVLSRRSRINISLTVIVLWCSLLLGLLIYRVKKKPLLKKELIAVSIGLLSGLLLTLIWFSIDTSASADGLDKFYMPPSLVKSTIFQSGATPLYFLLGSAVLTTCMSALAVISISKFKFLFSLLTATVIGISVTVLFYQFQCLETERSGTGALKHISYGMKQIEWHKDVPDEMMLMFDKKLQLMILDAKAKAKEQK